MKIDDVGGPRRALPRTEPEQKTHTVKQGETLQQIAKQHGVMPEEIEAANPRIQQQLALHTGQELKIPEHRVLTDMQEIQLLKRAGSGRPMERGDILRMMGVDPAVLNAKLDANAPAYPKDYNVVTKDELKRIMPGAADEDVARFARPLNDAMAEFGITTPARQSAFLAQVAHESGSLLYKEEIASGAAYEGRSDLGNTEPGDGTRFKGRGIIQLTGRANYREVGQALGLDLEGDPSHVVRDPGTSARVAAYFFQSRGLNQLADQGAFVEITHRINGGENGLSDRLQFWDRAKDTLGSSTA